jgi:ATP-dependent Clp protease ATP-binding subunit ClpC
LKLELSEEAKEFLIKKGANTDYGARPLRRAIESFIEDPLAEELLKGEFNGKQVIYVGVKKVGGKKQLSFVGLMEGEPEPEPEPVGVAAEAGGEESGVEG